MLCIVAMYTMDIVDIKTIVFLTGWMDGWVDGWVGGWREGWMDGCNVYKIYYILQTGIRNVSHNPLIT